MGDQENSAPGRLVLLVRLGILAVVAGVVLLSVGALWLEWGEEFSVQRIEETILAWGMWGVVASIGLMVLHSFVPFPAEVIAFANGMLYGPLWGTAITWSGAMLGALAAFGLTRLLGRPFVDLMVSGRKWRQLDDWAAEEGAKLIFISRFLPFIAFNLINYAAGLTRISWWTFTWTTGLGILPLTALMVYMGDNFEAMSWQIWLVILAGILLLCVLLRRKLRFLSGAKRGDGG